VGGTIHSAGDPDGEESRRRKLSGSSFQMGCVSAVVASDIRPQVLWLLDFGTCTSGPLGVCVGVGGAVSVVFLVLKVLAYFRTFSL
jgi:hypothetical protein